MWSDPNKQRVPHTRTLRFINQEQGYNSFQYLAEHSNADNLPEQMQGAPMEVAAIITGNGELVGGKH